jgi:hypothetical protein
VPTFMLRRAIGPAAALLLSSCGSESALREIAKDRWASSVDKCDTNFTTFNDRKVRFHSPTKVEVYGDIARVSTGEEHEVVLAVMLAPSINSERIKHGFGAKKDPFLIGLTRKGDRIQWRNVAYDRNGKRVAYYLYDEIRCPTK